MIPDLPRSPYSFTQLAECAERELHSRKSRYPGYVARHRMSQDMADAELEKMRDIGVLLRALARTELLV